MFEYAIVNLGEVYDSCGKIACCSCELIFTFLYACGNIQYSSEQFVSCNQLSFVNFALHPVLQTEIYRGCIWRLKQLCLGNHSELETCSYKCPFTTIGTITCYEINLSPESPCISSAMVGKYKR